MSKYERRKEEENRKRRFAELIERGAHLHIPPGMAQEMPRHDARDLLGVRFVEDPSVPEGEMWAIDWAQVYKPVWHGLWSL